MTSLIFDNFLINIFAPLANIWVYICARKILISYTNFLYVILKKNIKILYISKNNSIFNFFFLNIKYIIESYIKFNYT